MKFSKLRVMIKTSISTLALGGIVLFGSLLPDQAQAVTYSPAYTANTLGGSTATNVQSSFGFYFDVEGNVGTLNGLGFAANNNWSTSNYTVKLWSYVNGGQAISDYTVIASAVFMPGGPYTLQNNYFWQSIAGINLPDTYTTDLTDQLGYAISAIGDFSDTPGPSNTNALFEAGTASFNPKILYAGNGFNQAGFLDFDVPIFPDNTLLTDGFFNANMSFAAPVPGPLPLLGAAAGFAWTRRLRTRITASK
jgi:hypothetical protein